MALPVSPLSLALGLDALAQLALLAGGGGLGGLARGLQVVALDDGDQLAGLHLPGLPRR